MDWHSPQGSLLPTARPWLCVSGASRRGKAESSWLAQTVWGLALQPQLPRRCWVGLGWQPLHCYFSEVISEINHRTLSRGKGGLCCMQGDRRSQCWGCGLEAKTGASQQGRAGHQWSCASVAPVLSCLWEALLELQLGASLDGPWLSTRDTVSALPLSAGLGQLHFLLITLKIWGGPGFFLTAWLAEEIWGSFLLFPTAYCGEQAAHVDRWRGVTGVSYLLPSQHCIMILGLVFSASFSEGEIDFAL